MARFKKGSFVRYVGDPIEGMPQIGDLGRVLATRVDKADVVWLNGDKKGSSTNVWFADLAPDVFRRQARDMNDSKTQNKGVELYTALKKMNALPRITPEVISYATTRLASDPYVTATIQGLPESKRHDALVSLATKMLKEAFGGKSK